MKKFRPRFGIQARVLILAVGFTLLSALIILADSARSVSERLRRSTLQTAEYAVQTAADAVGKNIQEADSFALWCAVDGNVRVALLTDLPSATLTHAVYPILSNRYNSLRIAPYIQRLVLAGSNGRTVVLGTASNNSRHVHSGNVGLFPGLDGSGELPQWDRLFRDPLMQPGIDVTGIPVVRSISGSGASGWVYLSVSQSLITDALESFSLEEGAWLCWVMGDRLYRVEDGALTCLGEASLLPQPEDTADTLDGDTRLYTTNLDGMDCTLVLRPLGLHGLYLGEALPARALRQPVSLSLSPALVSLGLVLVLGLVAAALLRRVVGRPIAALQKRIEAVGNGDFTADPAIEWDHELGDVGRGINHLSQNVAELMSTRLEDEKQRLDLEYRMLQNQISPHFIYNTLNSIKWMATIQHAPGVAEMVTALSRLMKSVAKGSQKLVPLSEEFALLEDYFTIQRYRYGGTIVLEAAPLPQWAEDYRIPRFTLQPLAENAIFHGIEPKGGVGKLTITTARTPAGELLLSLADDGVGMTGEQIEAILSGRLEERDGEDATPRFRHVGLWNVHRLLQLSFGADYGLEIRSVPNEGTTITMRLPPVSDSPDPRKE